jgi:hypothetical protein
MHRKPETRAVIRLASLRYGIDDIRKVEAARVTDD